MDKFIEQDCREYISRIDLTPLREKTVLITGANGLIGTYLIYMLHLANLENGTGINIEAVSRSAPNKALSEVFEKNYRFHPLDLNLPDSLDMLQKADYIIHGATYAQPGKFLRNYLDTIHLNTAVAEKLLQKARVNNADFLYMSSSEVYGEPDAGNIPTPEEFPGLCSPVNIRAIYSEAKRIGETLCFAYKNYENVNTKIARISMTYGPGVSANDERVMTQFIRQALSKKEIIMMDSGSKIRTFCYIADCVLMLLNIMLYGTQLVYNVGGKESITIRKLAEQICDITGSKLSVENPGYNFAEKVKVSPQHVELNIGRICSEFGINEFKPMSEGLKRTIEWNRSSYDL